ncbi:diguanylate cyclase (GGDEF)-like protein [Azospirillum fermentarium]|uniref:putative bifunctional diguanylate cyclase/phosphodiesterase n=1 Tax=Azospirillum fermentarium TaxID=1233114 RepID=UPI002226F2BA|nr:GGDEF domain-containing phosphodiesterase [Azospirillum fermentarium]MCW2248331.1 diguanylate cyclase (GGDEF)-like protein [Azospirillum fermentarium]
MSSPTEPSPMAEAAGADGVWEVDPGAFTLRASPGFCRLIPPSRAGGAVTLADWLARLHPDDRPALASALAPATDGAVCGFSLDFRVADPASSLAGGSGGAGGEGEDGGAGPWLWLRALGMPWAGGRLAGTLSDITAQRMAEERASLALRGSGDGVWDWDLGAGTVHYSPEWKRIATRCSDTALDGTIHAWFARVVAADRAGLEGAIDMHLSGERPVLRHEFRMVDSSGQEHWVLVRGKAMRDVTGRAVRLTGTVTDITPRKKAEQQLLFDAFHDTMTGLANRTLLLDRVGQALNRDRRTASRPFAVLVIDLDRFKTVNETHGSAIGDRVLRVIAKRLEEARRMGDTLARVSADEFAMLLNDIDDVGDAITAAERLARSIAQPIDLFDHDIQITASIGIAHSVTGYERAEDLMRDASLAVFRAKQQGRNRVDVFDSNLRRQAMSAMRLETELRAALEQDQLCLFYQPIVSLAHNRIDGFEALIRWRHPERGLVPPGEFIPLAEETGLIVPIGRWALREAVRQIVQWQARFPRPVPLFMSVNVSPRQIHDDDLAGLVAEVLAGSGIPPSSLKLEITESLLMQDPAKSRDVMQRIRDMDVRLSIDDFGTGYSSLSYLHTFPADTLKIDRAFVSAISTGESSAAIVQVISTLAAILRMDVVAEGIETETEAEFLRDIMCKFGQGYLFHRPAPAEVVEALLTDATEDASDGAILGLG